MIFSKTYFDSTFFWAKCFDLTKGRKVTVASNLALCKDDIEAILEETKFVLNMEHSNVLKFYEPIVTPNKKKLAFVYESHECLLSEVLDEKVKTVHEPAIIKHIMKELFTGLAYLHENGVVHRDIQPQNIAITSSGGLKIWNFSHALHVGSPLGKMDVKHFRYQPLESVLYEGTAHPSLDIWSAMVIFGELWLTQSLFLFDGEKDICRSVFLLFGFPNRATWSDFFNFRAELDLRREHSALQNNNLDAKFQHLRFEVMSRMAWDLFQNCFQMNPKFRWTVRKCLGHPYFVEEPRASGSDVLLTIAELTQVTRQINKIKNELALFKILDESETF